jgi:hypothetical protein
MKPDSLIYDSSAINRPLPQWLINQKEGLNTWHPKEIILKEDHSVVTSFAFTGIFVVLLTAILTMYIFRKNRKKTK